MTMQSEFQNNNYPLGQHFIDAGHKDLLTESLF